MLRKLVINPYQSNCYILGCNNTKQGLIIDPGGEPLRIIKVVTQLGLDIRYILLTHFHFDHTSGVQEIRNITKAPVWIHPLDADGLGFRPDGHVSDGQIISLGNFNITVIHTPGHSAGGVCFHAPGVVFTGDALFAGSVGRTDFQGGNHNLLIQGIKQKIFSLGDGLRVYPGHGPQSTIGQERTTNPFFR
ncbi:MAG: MBL fold metallo-hydrolase [Desulfobacterium sp.]|nr:MBL fold metallo-hydrolase [Desulfobacterium sp.]MBU3950416.1 MBL fold metallo-hydrolase [Pseudomonadota bacterium]MBU4034996.1 MBL fold metallo-hydrolase [Pseudomonadota bacterium]